MVGPDCCIRLFKVFVDEIGAIVAVTTDFLYGEAFCGRTDATETKIEKILIQSRF